VALGLVEIGLLVKEGNLQLESLYLFFELKVGFCEFFFLKLSLPFFEVDGVKLVGEFFIFVHNLLELGFELLDFGVVGSLEFEELDFLLVFFLFELFL
jgi:hypothetical protein